MWSEKLQNGKYRFAERYTDPVTFKEKKVSIVLNKDTAAMRKLAMETLQKRIAEKTSFSKSTQYTLSQIKGYYIEYQKKTLKLSTVNRNDAILDRIFEFLDKDAVVDNIDAKYITSRLLKSEKSKTTLNEYLKRIKAMLRWAYDNNYTKNFELITKLKPFPEKSKKVDIHDKYLESDELKKLLAGLNNKQSIHWCYFCEFLSLSGLRVGEAIALTNQDIGDEYIRVNKTYDVHNNLVTSPKTISSDRYVFIQPELMACIRRIRLFIKEAGLKYGYRSDLFFPDYRTGSYINYYSFERYLHNKSEELIGRSIGAHALRHTHASLLLAQGVSVDTISRRLGHEDSKITKEIYLHVTKQLIEADNLSVGQVHIL